MRYHESDELHMDFHGATLMSANYIVENYGVNALQEIMQNVGTQVYRQINQKLKESDTSELIEFKEYFLRREGANFSIKSEYFSNLDCNTDKSGHENPASINPGHTEQLTSEKGSFECSHGVTPKIVSAGMVY